MNRIFSINPEDAWPKFPVRSYARLDHHEPDDLTTAQEAVFSFDAVDAGWFGLPLSERMDLGKPVDTHRQMRDFWSQLFKGSLSPPKDPFDEMPIYNIEVTSKKGDRHWDFLIAIGEEDWLDIELGSTGSFPVDVYGSLLAAPVIAHLLFLGQVTGDTATALSNAFDVDAWPDAADGDIDAILSGIGVIDMLAMYDIGQGSAIGLLDSSETARLYFDLGAGAYGNRQTRPKPLRFCWRGSPSIVLSHWDTDHWAGENSDHGARARKWVAPRQYNLGPRHHAFAHRILKNGGTLHIWSGTPGTIRSISNGPGQTISIKRCSGTSRNGSGIACYLDDVNYQASWLLTGDAGYSEIGTGPTYTLTALTVPHHGADMSHKGSPPAATAAHARLFYSFGPDNKHGSTSISHPTAVAVTAHAGAGWRHGAWSLTTPAQVVAGGDVLATASHSNGTNLAVHLDSAVAGWTAAPTVPLSTIPCASACGTKHGCTSNVIQA